MTEKINRYQLADTPTQKPLPNPDDLPAWVHMALARYDTQNASYLGHDILNHLYDELQDSSALERMTFKKLRTLAHLWQFANFRTYITSFEKQILDAEHEALQHRYAFRQTVVQYVERDRHGDLQTTDIEVYKPDVEWIACAIQKRLGSYGIIMGTQHIKATLNTISAVFTACEVIGREVEIVSSERKVLQNKLRKAS